METPSRFNFKRAWVLFWISTFVFYRTGQLELWPAQFVAGPYGMLQPLIFFANFPASLFYVVGVEAFLCDDCSGLDREPLFWMGMIVVGYLQWFSLLPFVLNRGRITTLDLNAQARSLPDHTAIQTPALHTVNKSSPPPCLSPPIDAPSPFVAHFDETGLTPLGRAIEEQG